MFVSLAIDYLYRCKHIFFSENVLEFFIEHLKFKFSPENIPKNKTFFSMNLVSIYLLILINAVLTCFYNL